MNHSLRDGNKRTAFAAMVVSLRMNGWDFALADDQAAALMLELIEQRRDKAWLAGRLAEASRARPSLELRDFFAQLSSDRFISVLKTSLANFRPEEFSSSMDDVRAAIPAIDVLDEMIEGASQDATIMILSGQAAVLHAIHRAAEDLGYEW